MSGSSVAGSCQDTEAAAAASGVHRRLSVEAFVHALVRTRSSHNFEVDLAVLERRIVGTDCLVLDTASVVGSAWDADTTLMAEVRYQLEHLDQHTAGLVVVVVGLIGCRDSCLALLVVGKTWWKLCRKFRGLDDEYEERTDAWWSHPLYRSSMLAAACSNGVCLWVKQGLLLCSNPIVVQDTNSDEHVFPETFSFARTRFGRLLRVEVDEIMQLSTCHENVKEISETQQR